MSAENEHLNGSMLSIPLTSVAEQRPITSRDLLRLREIGEAHGRGLSVSPDGQYMAFELHQADVVENSYRVAWFVASTEPNRKPINVGDAGEATLFKLAVPGRSINGAWYTETPTWLPNSQWIVYRRQLNGEIQLWRSDREGTRQEQLTTNASDVEEYHLSADQTKIFFSTDAPRKVLRKAERARIRAGYLFDYERGWSTLDGKPYRERYALTGGKPLVWVYDLASRKETPATEEQIAEYEQLLNSQEELEALPSARNVARTADGARVVWLQPTDPTKQGIDPPLTVYASNAPDGRDPLVCEAPECSGLMETRRFLGGLWWDDANKAIFFVRKEGRSYSERALYEWTPGDASVRRILKTDGWISACTRVDRRAICFRQTPRYPRTVISIDLSDGSMTTLVDPNPEFRNLRLGDVEKFEWTNDAGQSTFGFLVKPLNYVPGQRYPLVITGYHARYALRGGVGSEFPVHQLAANGFAVLVYERPADRAFQAVETDPLALAVHDWGPHMFDYRVPLSLFESAIDQLDRRGLVDPKHVGIAGLSNGAVHTGYALIYSDRFAAAIMANSQQSPASYFLSGVNGTFRRNLQSKTGFGRPGGPADWKWQCVSLALNADRVNTPLLIHASDFEHIRSLQDVITLIEAGKPVEMHVFPDEHHVKWAPVHRLAAYERSFDWFNFWLRNAKDPDPNKEDQYRRWQQLREALGADQLPTRHPDDSDLRRTNNCKGR